MYIDFGEYSPYSGTVFENVEKNVIANNKCDHGYVSSSCKVKICAWINKESCDTMEIYFSDARRGKKA